MKKLFFFLLLLPAMAQAQIIITVAGNGYGAGTIPLTGGYSGDNGPATNAELFSPTGVASDNFGNLYFADEQNHRIRKVDATGIITTIAGNGTNGCTGDGGPATSALIGNPYALATNTTGELFIADDGCHCIRKINTSGIITRVAGNGTYGFSGDNGPATDAQIYAAQSIALDNIGNIYIADLNNNRVRKVSPSGIITTIAGNGSVAGPLGDGGPATVAYLPFPYGITADNSGNVYIGDGGRIRKISTSGFINTIAGNDTLGYSGDNGPATAAKLNSYLGLFTDNHGNLFITDLMNNRVRKIDALGVIKTISGNGLAGYSGDGGDPILATFRGPYYIVLNASGDIYISDNNNNRIRCIKNDLAVGSLNSVSQDIYIYPNPAQDELNVVTADMITGIVIRDIMGQVVLSNSCHGNEVQINIAQLAAGVYTLQAHIPNRLVVTKQFIKA